MIWLCCIFLSEVYGKACFKVLYTFSVKMFCNETPGLLDVEFSLPLTSYIVLEMFFFIQQNKILLDIVQHLIQNLHINKLSFH